MTLMTDEAKALIRFERHRIKNLILSVERCMCPFTPGYGTPGWKPNLTLGMNGVHMDYCPFGIAKYIEDQPEQRRNAHL